jgi:hypothetical protein
VWVLEQCPSTISRSILWGKILKIHTELNNEICGVRNGIEGLRSEGIRCCGIDGFDTTRYDTILYDAILFYFCRLKLGCNDEMCSRQRGVTG